MRWGGIYMNSERMANVSLLMGTMENAGITNPYLQAAILGVIGKESKLFLKMRNAMVERVMLGLERFLRLG